MKHKRRALFNSLVSLLLCFSMLVGTTFAWFTDRVYSANNLIATGVLDVEMEYLDAEGNWIPVNETTEILNNNALWEPGYTEVAYLKISNVGDLALKYALGISVIGENGSINKAGEPFKLSDYIQFGVIESETEQPVFASREQAVAALPTSTVISTGYAQEGVLYPEADKDVRYATLVVYMPESVGNGANYATGANIPEIHLGIQLVATQADYESDSFGTDYDVDVSTPGFNFPSSGFGGNVSADVTTDAEGKVTENVTLSGTNTKAEIPAGVQLEDGTEKLTLEVSDVSESEANVTLGKNEEMRSLNVHVQGVSADNTMPMEIYIKEAAAKGLNAGNLKLYHVENGATVEMTHVDAFTAHNQFKYDPATGDITLYMATFSEVALVADTTAKWNGNVDHSWYIDKSSPYIIANADQLWSFSQIVGGMAQGKDNKKISDTFKDDIVKVISDINLNDGEGDGKVFYPIGYYNSTGSYEKTSGGSVTSSVSSFEGTFDGNGHTIANFYQNTWEMFGDYNDGYSGTPNHYKDAMGLFGYVLNGTVKNLTVNNFKSDGEFTPTGVIAAYADGNSTFENIAITKCNPRVYNTGNGGIIGIAGDTRAANDDHITLKNITVDNSNVISALWGSYDVACGGLVGMYRGNVDGSGNATDDTISFANCHVAAQIDVYNDVCGNYQYYAYRYAGMIIGSVRHNTKNAEGKTIPNMTGISATGCTVNYGDWNDYYYCEFEKNGHPSYSGPDDYKFSRVPHSELNFNKDGTVTCSHDHSTVEDNRAIYLPFHQLFTGYGWGVNSVGLQKYSGIVTNLDIEEGDQEASVEKFDVADTSKKEFKAGDNIPVGELFKALENAKINDSAVQVAVSEVNGSGVTGTYVAVSSDWTMGTLTFSGTGSATVSITDYNFCKPTVIQVTIIGTDTFKHQFPNTDKYLYRVGNQNPVALGSLFAQNEGTTVDSESVEITVDKVEQTSQAMTFALVAAAEADKDFNYTPNTTDWAKGTIKFENGFTGPVKVTIEDKNSLQKELYLEVVDAMNVTAATNATSNNVVLLNDCGLSSLTVSGRYTFYGNGFTMTYTGDGRYLGKGSGFKFGVVNVTDSGNLDNCHIKASVYPIAALYSDQIESYYEKDGDKTRYFYQLSAVAISGNACISNCYIYGGRNNVYVGSGNARIEDSVLENGTLSNVQIVSSNEYTVTLHNVTTIQKRTHPTTYANDTLKNNQMLGFGVIVGDGDSDTTPTNPKLVLSGNFKQYNWVTRSDWEEVTDTYAKEAINAALNNTDYQHTNANGEKTANLGVVVLNTESFTDPKYQGYKLGDIKIAMKNGRVYSISAENNTDTKYEADETDRVTENGLYQPQFKYSENLGGQYIEKTDVGDEHCYREGDTIKVMFPTGSTKELDLAGLVNITKYSEQDLNLNISCKDSNGNPVTVNENKITLSAEGTYVVTYTVTDKVFYDKDGNMVGNGNSRAVTVEDKTYSWNVTVEVSLKEVSIPNARFEFDSSKQVIYRSGNSNIVQFIPFLAGLKIYDYNGQDEYLRFDGDNEFHKIAKASINNINTTGEGQGYHIVTIEFTDGGKLVIDMDVRANSGSSTHSGSIKVRNNVLYVVNGGTTSGKGQTWKIYSYKFVGNNGTEINSGLITFGKSGVDCATATKPSSNFGTTVKYTVTYDANGGNCGQNTGYATSESTAVTLPTPTRSGYIFAGWYTAVSGGTKVGGAGDSYTPSANITLYAQWGKPCDVTYDANGGSCGTASEKYNGTALTLPTPTRDGYWFIGWYDAATGGNKIGDAGAKYNPGNEITLYAHWQEAIKYTVTYNANGGSCGTASATYEGTALTLPTPTRTGYKFLGWYTAASGGTKIGDAGTPYMPSANITLYAQWQINSYTINVTTNNATVKVNGTTVNNNGTVTIQYGVQVTVEVTYSESNDRSTTIKGTDGTTYNSPFTMPAQNVTINATSSGCVTPDTLITLADGSQVRVDSLTGNEMLLVWNLETGKYDTAPIVFVDNEQESAYEIIHLYFSDGSDVKVIYEHGFFDLDLGKYVYIDATNYADFIGHRFVTEGDIKANNWNVVTLDEVVIESEVTTAWSPVTFEHLCYYTNGVLSMPGGIEGLFNIFDVDTRTMRYDAAKMQKDIETYGLFAIEDFGGMITEDAFNAFNGAYLKVAMGKGLLTWEDIAYMAERYIPLM